MPKLTIEEVIQGMNEHQIQVYPRKIKEGETQAKGVTASFQNPNAEHGRSFIDRAPVASNDRGQEQWAWRLGRDCEGKPNEQVSAEPVASSPAPANITPQA